MKPYCTQNKWNRTSKNSTLKKYTLYNQTTEETTKTERISEEEAISRNADLRTVLSPLRWMLVY